MKTDNVSQEGLHNYQVRRKIEDMVLEGEHQQKKPSPLIEYQTAKAFQLIKESERKGALQSEKKYNRLRQAFEQNYQKLHPYKSTP